MINCIVTTLLVSLQLGCLFGQVQSQEILKHNHVSGIVGYTYFFNQSGALREEHFDVDSSGRIVGTFVYDDSTSQRHYTYTLEYDTNKHYFRESHFWSNGEPIYEITKILHSDSIELFYMEGDSLSREVHYIPNKEKKWIKVFADNDLIRKYKFRHHKEISIDLRSNIKSITRYKKDEFDQIVEVSYFEKYHCKKHLISKEEIVYTENGLYLEKRNYIGDSLYSNTLYEYTFR
ncbi:hypothetical protein [Parvicella tangerina]|uniref:Uncharacterized protein n=1 Tax=Parvicella tangerina TaxID=2829795 RepID=A0A916JPU4_9FLAO|nr:hypothetical protein [Parvicella tangerina]CAG5085946.1 hypothetical protein CRYO30217_02942 [Parvicella tangerina]